jgi:tRNA(Ile)-lysidine synthase
VIPMLRLRWPKVVNNLVRTSGHCRQAQANLDDLAKMDCPALRQRSPVLPIAALHPLDSARISNVLRLWFKNNKLSLPSTAICKRLIDEVIAASEDADPQVTWNNICVRRYQQALYLMQNETKPLPDRLLWCFFPDPIHLEGIGDLQAKKEANGLVFPPQGQIEIRFRQGGELFNWHGQTKQLKKLFQQWGIPPWLRGRIPLLYVNTQLAAVIGYAMSDRYYRENSANAYQLSLGPFLGIDP